MKILFTISSLGLGHATRTIPVINYYLNLNYNITIISYGNALKFLKTEFKHNKSIKFISKTDYPSLERGNGFKFYFYLILDIISTNLIIKKEQEYIKKHQFEFDFIFSDGRYGFYSKKIPSFLLSHQISFIMPKYLSYFKFISNYFNYLSFKKFDKIFIPDFKFSSQSLSGKLSHINFVEKLNYEYINILSSYKKENLKKDIDFLFIISGYLLEHKESFISNLINQSKEIKGKKVFILGDTSKNEKHILKEFDITIYSFVSGKLKNDLFNRSKVIISRSGYTTVLDLVQLDKKAILVSTKNQTEQEYLAKYLNKYSNFVTDYNQDNFNLKNLIFQLAKKQKSKKFNKINFQKIKNKNSLNIINNEINKYLKHNFFSIIIPAYNEEKYIKTTLEFLKKLEYDRKYFEIIIVENGSTDKTFNIIQEYKKVNKNLNIKIFQSEKGVSKARNLGLFNTNENSDYCVFLDADTILEKLFLKELNYNINKMTINSNKNLVIGTTSISPFEKNSKKAQLWFKFYDIGHKYTKTSYSIQIARTNIAKKIKYDTNLNYSEDLKFIKKMLKKGDFLFINTNSVKTSIRRFEKQGFFYTFLKWNIEALIPERYKKNLKYNNIR